MKTTVLVVDDNPLNRQILVDFLSPDYEVFLALHGEEALEILQKNEIQIILLDIHMPGMGGYKFCQIVRSQGNNIPVIFLSASAFPEDRKLAYQAGGNYFFSIPFDFNIIDRYMKSLVTIPLAN